jgi:hypothetical protein
MFAPVRRPTALCRETFAYSSLVTWTRRRLTMRWNGYPTRTRKRLSPSAEYFYLFCLRSLSVYHTATSPVIDSVRWYRHWATLLSHVGSSQATPLSHEHGCPGRHTHGSDCSCKSDCLPWNIFHSGRWAGGHRSCQMGAGLDRACHFPS